MGRFDKLVGQQLQTMDQLLYLQGEISRLEEEMIAKKKEFLYIQQLFERQTEAVILSFEEEIKMEI